ncbi:co-chaperone YbbN [Bradyrhizobium sp. th.b2]|uniref:thioredoxin family protein n=1 Tax=Bradyrhizobium sp. th-b2 TaxID=172088 RepID=UPI00040D90C8|nr:thioredoxin domain-containing protein [Bradyrhizobium sp. th.b2]
MKAITDATLVAEFSAAKLPVIIKFEAKWCQPCKAMTPTLNAIEQEYGQRVQFFTANVEHCDLMAQRFQVSQIPALVAMENGVVLAKRVGSGSKQEIAQWMRQSIPGARDER